MYLQEGSSRATVRRLAAFLANFAPMKFHRPIAIASLPWLFAACSGTPEKHVETPKTASSTSSTSAADVHVPAGDTTTANAGAAKCTLQNVQQIGALAKDSGIALGFGQQGGLVAWTSPDGPRVKPLTTTGIAKGSAIPIQFPKGTQPIAVASVARGFAVIAKRIETMAGPCEATSGEKPGPEVKPSEAAPPTCEKPTGNEFFVQLTDVDGQNASAGRPFHTGLVELETFLPGDGRAFGILTKNEVIWVQKRPDAKLDAERVELPNVEQVVPVMGAGPPAVLLIDKDGSMLLLDERGTHEIDGSFLGKTPPKPAATAPPKPAAAPPKPAPAAAPPKPAPAATPPKPAPAGPPPAKPVSNVHFYSHWGPKGRIEISRRVGDTTQYGVIEKLVLRILKDTEDPEIRNSFANSVEVRLENGKLRRMGWNKQPVGGDIDVHEVDAAADASHLHFAWSGSAFVFAHPSNPPHRTEAPAVGIVTATCGSDKL